VVDFINEVEEELRKDEYNKLLKKWGPLMLAVIVAIIAAAGYIEWNKSSEDRAARATSAAFVDAANLAADGNTDAAVKNFLEIADQASAGYSGLSLMRAAALKLEAGETQEAVSLFDQAAQSFTEPRHTQLAQLKSAYILAGQGRYDDVRSRLVPLAEKDAPYEFLARELLGFTELESGKASKAREQFSYLETIPGVPQTIQERAKQSLSLMKVDATAKAPANPVAPDSQDALPNKGDNEDTENE